MNTIEQHDLVLYAINTGEFYSMHCAMARNNVGEDCWREWIRHNVMPRYRREIEPKTITTSVLLAGAQELREYYQQHVTE